LNTHDKQKHRKSDHPETPETEKKRSVHIPCRQHIFPLPSYPSPETDLLMLSGRIPHILQQTVTLTKTVE
jgi:hypothetical protein